VFSRTGLDGFGQQKNSFPCQNAMSKNAAQKISKRLMEHEIPLLCSPLLSLTLSQSDTKPVRTVTTNFFTIRFNFDSTLP